MGTCQWAYLSRAKIKEKYLDDLDGALIDIKESRRYEKWWYEPYFYKARILFNQGKFEEFYRVQKIAHRKLYLDITYGNYWGSICDYEGFLDQDNIWFVFYDFKAKCDNSAELKFMRAKYFLKKENYEQAYLNINQALNLKANNEEFLELKSKILKKDISL